MRVVGRKKGILYIRLMRFLLYNWLEGEKNSFLLVENRWPSSEHSRSNLREFSWDDILGSFARFIFPFEGLFSILNRSRYKWR